MKQKKIRLDKLLVMRGFAADETFAKALVLARKVIGKDRIFTSSAEMIAEEEEIRVKNKGKSLGAVGRGYDKLKGAIVDLSLSKDFVDKIVLDIGASTGGFAQCLLDFGAKKVVAIDVGTNQLAWKLRKDPRVDSLEKTDIRGFTHPLSHLFDWIVADISFNSLSRLALDIKGATKNSKTRFLLLVKPQFELQKNEFSDGIVREDNMRKKAVDLVQEAFKKIGGINFKTVDSQISGHKGNREIFILIDF